MDACRNCTHPLGEPRPNYCPSCGQETNLRPPTLGEFAQQFGGSIVATEGALWRTLRLLLRPGRLTLEYFAGRRRRYVLPLRLYLTISVVALLMLRVVGAIQIGDIEDTAVKFDRPSERSFTLIGIGHMRAGVEDGTFFCSGLPRAICARLQDRFDLDPKAIARHVHELPERFLSHWGAAMFLLVPAFAMWLKLVYLNRRLRYTEHLVFALHLHAFWFLMLMVFALPIGWLADTAALAIPVYAFVAMRRVYGGRWWTTLARAATQAVLYSLTTVVALLFVGMWSVLA